MAKRLRPWLQKRLHKSKIFYPSDYGTINSGSVPFNPDPYFDLLNLQSNSDGNFINVSGAVSQWTDLSPSGRNATQGTAGARPLYNSGLITFDGSDDALALAADISFTTGSVYILFRNNGALTKAICGALATTTYMLQASPSLLNLTSGGVTKAQFELGMGASANSRLSILGIRRTGNSFQLSVNDRTLLQLSNTYAGEATLIGFLSRLNLGGFFMNSVMRCFCVLSTVPSDAIHAQLVNALYTRYNLASLTQADNVCGFGDSNTRGQGTTSYLVALASSLSIVALNLGISGTRLTDVGGTANNGIGRYQSQIITKPYRDYVVIQYGTNDILAGISAATYGPQLNTVVSGIISAGYLPSRICLCSCPYQQAGANATLLDDYRTQILSIATALGTKYFDLLQDMRDNGGDTLLSDSVHLNATGMTRWQNGVFTALTT